ncbi:MAG: electron transfer flavoprotein subunit alpha/FixB family protein [Bacteroidetes bacterium]|uniref:Electron transfer flavoprotein subunit alpha/FixB family protein n=1 Tax=Candidatus Egerieousia excrementavium TaxID=2840778 RepID=A0A9D9DME3_9BACT|nr:electron transfer flavoprotein subunit alpha/FixB family protein [Candidatus Egerieousia excrementavium]
MNNIIVFCETDNGKLCDVSLELLTKGRALAQTLKCDLEALLIGFNVENLAKELYSYGAKRVHLADNPKLEFFRTLPYAAITIALFKEEKPQIALFGATSIGRDLAPRVSSALHSGLTADCTSLEIGDHQDAKGNRWENLLYQIRPAFGGNIIATIVNPEHRPQMATVREGVMKKEPLAQPIEGSINRIDTGKVLMDTDFVVSIIERQIEEKKIDIKSSQIIVAGGYGVGSKENFKLIFDLAKVLGAEVGASRAAVDAGFVEHERQVGQTGVTVRPKLFISVGISGQIQHTAGMDQSSMIISINSDPDAPIHQIADYAIIGDLNEVIPKMIASYKKHSK